MAQKFLTDIEVSGKLFTTDEVGIGVSDALAKLHVDSSTAFSLTSAAGDTLFLSDDTNESLLNAVGASIGFSGPQAVQRQAAISALRTGDDHDRIGLAFYTHPGTSNDETIEEKVRITHDGKVGINAIDPLRTLHVVGNMAVNAGTGEYYGVLMTGGEGANPKITIGDWHNSSGTIHWDSSANILKIDSQHSTATSAIAFTGNDGATEYARFTSTGKLGIGVAASIDGTLTLPNSGVISFHDANGAARNSLQFVSGELKHGAAGAGLTSQSFFTNAVERIRINSDGTVGIGTNALDTAGGDKLHVDGTLRVGPYFSVSDRDYIKLIPHGTDTKVYSPNERFHIENPDGHIVITPSTGGGVGIGLDDPDAKVSIYQSGGTVLDVQGSDGQLFSVTDSLNGDLFSVSDVSGMPILNVNSSGLVDIDGDLNLGDGNKIQLGDSQDLHIFHDGSNSFIRDNGTGGLVLEGSNMLELKARSGEIYLRGNENSSVQLYHNNNIRLNTSNAGVEITGNISAITASGHDFMLGNSNNTTTADTSGFRMHQSATYDDGRYAHRFRKYDHGGGIPLYIDGSGSTANIFTALARFGTYTNEGKTFEVFGTMGATNFSGSSEGTNTGDQTLPTDFVSAANGGTFGGNVTIKHASSPTLFFTDDSPDPDNIGKIDVANNYMTYALDAADGTDSSRHRFQLDGTTVVEILPNTTYFRQTNLHLQNTAVSNINFRKNAAIVAGADIGKINFAATNDEGSSYPVGGNIIYEGDGTWDLSSISNAPTRMKIQLRNSSAALSTAMMLSSNLNANFYGDISATGDVTANGVTLTGDQTLPTDFVSAASGGTFSGNLSINIADGGSAPAMTAVFNLRGYEGRGAGIKIKDNVNSAASASSREWFVGSGYNQAGFNIGYSATGSQSSYVAQNKFALTTSGNATFAGTVTANGTLLTGDQTLPTDFVSAASGGTFAGTVNISPGSTAVSTLNLRRDATGDSTIVGDVNFMTSAAEGTDDRIGLIRVQTSAGDGTTRGGEMRVYTRKSGSADFNTTIYDKAGNWSLPSNLTVGGNLTVEGTVTTLNTATVEVEDNILQLNTTQASTDTATAATSGISIYRGVDASDVAITQASLIFDEADDTWDLTNNLTIAGDVLGAAFAIPSGASTGFLKADGSVDGTTYSGYNFGETDLTFQGADTGDIVWKAADGTEVHRIWAGSADYLTYRNDAGTTYELISAGSTSYNNGDWDNAFTHAESDHAPTNAEQNVQSDWNETTTTSDAFILNKLTDYVSAASGGTFGGDLTINADVTINGSTDNTGAVTPRILDFTTNPTNAGLAGSGGYQIGEIAFTGKDSSSNAAGKYGRIRGSIVDSNTTIQGSGGEGGKLQFTLLKHDVGGSARVEYDILTLDPLVAEVDGQLDVSGNIRLTGGGVIEAPSSNGAENLILKAAGGVDVIIDTNGNGGDNEIFRVMHHTSTVLFEVQEGGEVRFADGIRISGTEDRISSVGSSMYIGGGGFGNSLVQFSGKPIPDSSYSYDFGASNRYWNQCYLGTIHLKSALLSNQENTDIDSAAAEVVASVAHATYTAAFFDFVIKKGTNIKSGTVFACHDGTNVEFTETSTADLGDTSDVTLSVDISGTDMRLLATVTSDDWSVKSLIRAL